MKLKSNTKIQLTGKEHFQLDVRKCPDNGTRKRKKKDFFSSSLVLLLEIKEKPFLLVSSIVHSSYSVVYNERKRTWNGIE